MSAAVEQRPTLLTDNLTTTDDGANSRNQSGSGNGSGSRFTAVNSHSPQSSIGGEHKHSDSMSSSDRSDVQPHSDAHANSRKRKRDRDGPQYGTVNGNGNGDHDAWASHSVENGESADVNLVEALRSADQSMSDHDKFGSGSQANANAPLSPDTPTQAPIIAQHFQKQRKRNFANRTKTGCLTCRERKKKCDERKPTCHNCERGGFVCKGYVQVNQLKGSSLRDNQPIQAKNGGYDGVAVRGYQAPRYSMHPSGGYYLNSQAQDDPRDGRRSPRSDVQPDSRSSSSYPRQSWPPDYHPDDGRAGYSVPTGIPPPPPPSSQPPGMHGRPLELPPPPAPQAPPMYSAIPGRGYSDPRVAAQLALQHVPGHAVHPPPPPPPPPPIQHASYHQFKTEKDKMINHQPFNSSDAQLRDERRICKEAVQRFNSTTHNPDYDDSERLKRFKQILEPEIITRSSSSGDQRDLACHGYLGDRAQVEAPFSCDYGYNIEIGEDTEIGANCRMLDSAFIKLGQRCMVGPDVSFYTHDGCHYDPNRAESRGKRLLFARPISIGDDVFIGGGAIIMPGISIGNGATIGAGTVVIQSVKSGHTVTNDFSLRQITGAWGH